MKEIWKDIPGYKEFYQASNFGRIRSIDRKVKHNIGQYQFKRGKILSPAIDRLGYLSCALSKNNKLKSFKVHRLIALAFLGIPNLFDNEVNHKDANKLNNHVNNLEWVNRSYNIIHTNKLGLRKYYYGEDHPNSKLTNKQRMQIIQLRKNGLTLKEISNYYPVHFGTISKIIQNYKDDKS